jgi:hypothetical protein
MTLRVGEIMPTSEDQQLQMISNCAPTFGSKDRPQIMEFPSCFLKFTNLAQSEDEPGSISPAAECRCTRTSL